MVGTLVCLVIIVALLLIASIFCAFGMKAQKGENKQKWRIVLCHILSVEYESEHKDAL